MQQQGQPPPAHDSRTSTRQDREHAHVHPGADARPRPTRRRLIIGKAIAAVGILYALFAAAYGAWLLWAFVTSGSPWILVFAVGLLVVAGILGWVFTIRWRADPADPARYAASSTTAAKGGIALSVVIALMGSVNVGFFIIGAGLWSLVIGAAALGISVLVGTAAGRQLRGRARRATTGG